MTGQICMARTVSEEDLLLRKRARRRLVGAIALVIVAIVILPMMLDQTPKPENEEIEITIPSENLSDKVSSDMSSETSVHTNIDSDVKESAPVVLQTEKIEPDLLGQLVEEKEKQGSKLAKGTKSSKHNTDDNNSTVTSEIFVVQLGAFSDLAKAKHQLRNLVSNGIEKSYMETLKNKGKKIWRVRIGPFSTREVADEKLKKLRELGLDGVVMTK